MSVAEKLRVPWSYDERPRFPGVEPEDIRADLHLNHAAALDASRVCYERGDPSKCEPRVSPLFERDEQRQKKVNSRDDSRCIFSTAQDAKTEILG